MIGLRKPTSTYINTAEDMPHLPNMVIAGLSTLDYAVVCS